MLHELQTRMAHDLLSGTATLAPQIAGAGLAPERRLAVYHHNVHTTLVAALKAVHPAAVALVGDGFFTTAARHFLADQPPASGCLLDYGAGFADFLAFYAPAASVPWLADVARVDWAWHLAFHGPEAPVLDPAALAGHGAEALERVRLRLHPTARTVSSAWPVGALWRLGREGGTEPVDLDAGPGAVLVLRPRQAVTLVNLPPGGLAVVTALVDGAPLATAAARAPDSDLQALLADLLQAEAFTAAQWEDTP